jgi:hypothetical protein
MDDMYITISAQYSNYHGAYTDFPMAGFYAQNGRYNFTLALDSGKAKGFTAFITYDCVQSESQVTISIVIQPPASIMSACAHILRPIHTP